VTGQRDRWAEWLLRRRFGGEAQTPVWAARLENVRDRVLDGARLESGEALLDVGAGDGLIAFGALERGAREVVFADISDDLLAHARELAAKLGVADRCRFVHAAADDLAPIETGSVDVVTTRSVLIYVARKAEAFAEFHRVLRPGGRVSLFEPINRYGSEYRTRETLWGFPVDGLGEVRDKLNAVFQAIQGPNDPMLDFDERDLVRLAVDAGFFPVELDLQIEVVPIDAMSWERFVNSAGNPKIPSLAEAMDEVLDAGERARLERHLQPLVERGAGVGRWAAALLRGTKPG
jgi:SAM-dependent methyltransferase